VRRSIGDTPAGSALEGFDAPEVIVVGGGPGGAIVAARLAQKGRRVTVLERERFPRFHLGESLLPQSMGALQAVGVLEAIDARFLRKHGASFHDSATGRSVRFDFADAFHAEYRNAYQVPRDTFDELLLRRAEELGADVRESWSVTRVRFEEGRAVGVEARDPEGAAHSIDAKIVVDATGRDALLAHANRTTERIQTLDMTALFSHWDGAFRDEGVREGDIQIVLFGRDAVARADGSAPPGGWFWFIPFKDKRTSVGAVVRSEWMRAHKGESVEALYRHAIAESPVATRFLASATQLWPARATADFSFRVRDLSGDGWLAVGDSGGFIDPLFSTGAHVAMHGGLHAADAIDAALALGDVSRGRFLGWERYVRRGADLFLTLVESFYRGMLPPLLFAEKPHPYLRRVITSMLAGDVFDEESRWIKDARTRFQVRESPNESPNET
jgi:flavin-dependent dehydrogenase